MYLGPDTVDNCNAGKLKPQHRFGTATLPTKLKQTASFSGKLSSSRQASAPQMNRKSPTKFKPTLAQPAKLEARRQVSAPQIGNYRNTLPDEVREVYERIKKGQKVPKKMPPLKVDKYETSPRLAHQERRKGGGGFKPASHFSELRGYEHALPSQICVS